MLSRLAYWDRKWDRRLEDAVVLSEMDTEYVFVTMMGIDVPKDLFAIILSYLPRDRTLLDSVACVNFSCFTVLLTTWEDVLITPEVITQIPLAVLRSTKILHMDGDFSYTEIAYICDQIDFTNVRVVDDPEWNLIKWCVGYKHRELLPVLIAKSTDSFMTAKKAFNCAANIGDMDLIRKFLDDGMEVTMCQLEQAAMGGNIEAIQFLLGHFDVTQELLNELCLDAARTDRREAVRFFRTQGAVMSADTALFATAEKGNVKGVRYYLDHVDDERKGVDWGIQLAAQHGHIDVVKLLTLRGANLHAHREQALRFAAQGGHLEVVKFLVRQGADVHARWDGALYQAADNGYLDVVEFLVEKGADIHAQREAALIGAASRGWLDVVEFLVGHGADIHRCFDDALIKAATSGWLHVVEFLVEKGADIHAQREGALRGAASRGWIEVVEYLTHASAK